MSLFTRSLVGLALAAAACAQTQTLTLVFHNGAAPSPRIFAEMKRETARLIEAAGYSAEWLERSAASLGREFDQLVVVQFNGASNPGASLARTEVTDGSVLPFVTVDAPRTAQLLSDALRELPSGARDVILGRALGRVMAHELYHVLAKTAEHKTHGVSKACFRASDLLANRLQFDPISLAQMRSATPSRALTAEVQGQPFDGTSLEETGAR